MTADNGFSMPNYAKGNQMVGELRNRNLQMTEMKVLTKLRNYEFRQ